MTTQACFVNSPTRLYYSTEFADGEVLELTSVQMESQQYNIGDDYLGAQHVYAPLSAGKVVFEIRGNPAALIGLFDQRTLVNWMIEIPKGMSFMFAGYVEEIETSCIADGLSHSKIKVRIAGKVNAYYDGPVSEKHDVSDVFSKKASRAQAKVMASVLRTVLTQPTAMGMTNA